MSNMVGKMIRQLTLALAVAFSLPAMAIAQSQFDPKIIVNSDAITQYDIDQRVKLLRAFRTPGRLNQLARNGLIEDKLKLQELNRSGMTLSAGALRIAMADFASRADMSLESFIALLASKKVDENTFAEFVRVGVSWRDLVRDRFNSAVIINDADIDRLISQGISDADGIELLLSEIIIAAPPKEFVKAMATARQISRLSTPSAFSAQARKVSAIPSRSKGGKLDWSPLSNYPAALHDVFLGLEIGEVTAPIPITNGVALFQLRGIREVAAKAKTTLTIEYAQLFANSESDAREIASDVDTCDDLYGLAFGQPDGFLTRETHDINSIPTNVALELARLDQNEISYNLGSPNGDGRTVIMLCQRNSAAQGTVDREAARNALRGQRLSGYADALLADLRASASIRTQ